MEKNENTYEEDAIEQGYRLISESLSPQDIEESRTASRRRAASWSEEE